MHKAAPQNQKDWWRGAVIYQVYPRSFQDSNNDGIGDIPGLISRLPYIAALGVDAIWIGPVFKSPQCDFGYDVSDYRAIAPIFGTMADCDRLIYEAHRHGLKLIFDFVFSHTSDQHAWFKQSRQRENGYDNWYVWADPKPDGSPPNNWVSLFGGPAWSFDPLRGQYYLHNFLTSQPDLNFHEPAVQNAVLDIVKFWLGRGVDGLRLDVVNFYFHDQSLENNPPRPRAMAAATQYDKPDPYNMQAHIHDKSQPENLAFVERLRALTNSYEARMLMGEIGDDNQTMRMAEYTHGQNRLHTAYSFAMLTGLEIDLTAPYIATAVMDELTASHGQSWPTWAFGNHDMPRAVTRMGKDNIANPHWPKLLMALLLGLRGSICIYQGEELGLPEARIAYDDLQDPWGKHLWPVWQGRDGCRTPMPWNDGEPHAGFSPTQPWLPVAPEHAGRAVRTQEQTPDSPLHETRRLLAFRRAHTALVNGDITFIEATGKTLTFTRTGDAETLFCAFNLGDETITVKLPAPYTAGISNQASFAGDVLTLSPFGFALVSLG